MTSITKENEILQLLKEGKYRFKRKANNDKAFQGLNKRRKKEKPTKDVPKEKQVQPYDVMKEMRQRLDPEKFSKKKPDMTYIKKADYLMEREELNEEDLEIIIHQIEKEEEDKGDVDAAKQYFLIT